ncbi:MAG: HAD family hydrolase [Armatimonadota bacterium]
MRGVIRAEIQALSFDFADTLYPHRPDELERVLRQVAASLTGVAATDPVDFFRVRDTFLTVRDRQFAENRAKLCENDLDVRFAECAQSVGAEPTDIVLSAMREAYTSAFVSAMVLPPWLPTLLEDLSSRYRLCLISNYPLSTPIYQTLDRDNMRRFFDAVIVSADLGVIKPHPRLFAEARKGLGDVPAENVLHIGDDWDADILGAGQAGMQTVYTRQWRAITDKHYQTGDHPPLAEIDDLRQLPDLLNRLSAG